MEKVSGGRQGTVEKQLSGIDHRVAPDFSFPSGSPFDNPRLCRCAFFINGGGEPHMKKLPALLPAVSVSVIPSVPAAPAEPVIGIFRFVLRRAL